MKFFFFAVFFIAGYLLPVACSFSQSPCTFEPPDGQAYFGFTFRSWDGPALTYPAYGDMRTFPVRYADAIQIELGGKSPSLFTVPVIWQDTIGGSLNPFSDALTIINKFKNVDMEGVPMILWNSSTGWGGGLANGITTKTVASGTLDTYGTPCNDGYNS